MLANMFIATWVFVLKRLHAWQASAGNVSNLAMQVGGVCIDL